MRGFDLGCFPWFGYIELSFLTTKEEPVVAENPGSEIAAWRFYDFASTQSSKWPRGAQLAQWVSGKDESLGKDAIFRACAEAVRAPEVQTALQRYRRTEGFVCTVIDPDDPDLLDYVGGATADWGEWIG